VNVSHNQTLDIKKCARFEIGKEEGWRYRGSLVIYFDMNTNRLIIFVIVALVVVGAAIYYTDNNELPEIDLNPAPVVEEDMTEEVNNEGPVTELQIEDVTVGTGAEAAVGDDITVHYVGTLADGTVFDSSRARGESITFGLNPGGLIQGWIEGIPGMKEGGVRKLVIPGSLAYGENPPPGSPFGPNATLYFEVELIKAVKN